jgi:hypothetical protein
VGDDRDDAAVMVAQRPRDLARRQDKTSRRVQDDLDRLARRSAAIAPSTLCASSMSMWRINGMPRNETVSCRWMSVITLA